MLHYEFVAISFWFTCFLSSPPFLSSSLLSHNSSILSSNIYHLFNHRNFLTFFKFSLIFPSHSSYSLHLFIFVPFLIPKMCLFFSSIPSFPCIFAPSLALCFCVFASISQPCLLSDHHNPRRGVCAGGQHSKDQVEGDQSHRERGHGPLSVFHCPTTKPGGHGHSQQVASSELDPARNFLTH